MGLFDCHAREIPEIRESDGRVRQLSIIMRNSSNSHKSNTNGLDDPSAVSKAKSDSSVDPAASTTGVDDAEPSPRVAQRQDEILSMAGRVFADRGYRQTDVQVIADALVVGKGTIYRYFPTKEELFFAAVDRMMQRLTKEVDARVRDEPDRLRRFELGCVAYLSFFDRERDAVELFLIERAEFKNRKKHTYFQHREANSGKWLELVRGLINDGTFRDIPPKNIVEVISNAVYGTMFTNHFAGREKTFEEQAADIMNIVFHGVLRNPAKAGAT